MLGAEVKIIPSKSYAHRAYICDFLAGVQNGGESAGVVCDLDSDDIRATRECLDSLAEAVRAARPAEDPEHGICDKKEQTDYGGGSEEYDHSKAYLDCGESGSTLRFMLPLAGALGVDARFITRGRLAKRPLGDLERELTGHGMTIEHKDGGIIEASGKLTSGVFSLPGTVSSQYVTGLLLALPYLDGGSRIELTSDLQSSAYVDITLDVMKDFGITVSREYRSGAGVKAGFDAGDNEGEEKRRVSAYMIEGGQKYLSKGPYVVEGDWSQAAFWLAAGAIGKGPVTVSGLDVDSVQGDRKIVDVLRSFGAEVRIAPGPDAGEHTGQVVTVYPSVLSGAVVDVSEIPDLAPAIACAAAAAAGETRLVNAERLRLKESDRIRSIVNCLNSIGVRAEEGDSEIIIYGCGHIPEGIAGADGALDKVEGGMKSEADFPEGGKRQEADLPEGGEVDTAGDHRIVMMAAVISLITSGKVTILGSGSVSKSYPTFFSELSRIGADTNIVRL